MIGGWRESWTESEIASTVDRMVAIWKKNGNGVGNDSPPYEEHVTGHPVYAEDLGTTQQVLLIGLDANHDAVGYAILTEQIPD